MLRVRAIGPANTPDLSPATWNWTADGEANANSAHPAVAGDGSYIAFESDATNLVDSDTNGQKDVFVENQTSQTFKRISINANGDQVDGPSYSPSVSDDGRLIAFQSDATNLVPGDTNRASDVFVYDQADRSIRRVSVTDTGAEIGPCPPQPQACSSSLLAAGSVPAISGNGKYITFVSQQGPVVAGGPSSSARQVYVYDRLTQRTVDWVSVGLSGQVASGRTPAISADGGYVAFSSVATNLVNGDTNGVSDVFLRDRTAHTTRRVSVSSGGAQGNGASANPAISDDGRYVAFDSTASNLVVTDLTGAPDTDTDGVSDVFRYDQIGAVTYRVSKKAASSPEPNGGSYLPQIAGDGQHVAFESDASNNTQYTTDGNGARDIFTWDASPLAVKPHSVRFETNVPTGNGPSSGASITNDGAFVSYKSDASDLSPAGDTHTTDVLVHEVGPCINTFLDRVDRLHAVCDLEAHGYADQVGTQAWTNCMNQGGAPDDCLVAYWRAYIPEYSKRYAECIARLGSYS
jgi:Tol biopolymer transport system component